MQSTESFSKVRSIVGLAVLSVLLIAAGCGDSDGTIQASSPPTSEVDGSRPGAQVELSDEFCAVLDSPDAPTNLADLAPEGYEDASAALVLLAQVFDDSTSQGPAGPRLAKVADALGAEGIDTDLADLAASAAAPGSCASADSAALLGSFSVVARFAQADALDDYCALLDGGFGAASDGQEPDPAAWAAAAPPEHRDALEGLDELMAQDQPGADAVATASGTFFGLGLYAEARCGIDGAFSNAAVAGAMFGVAAGSGGVSGGSDDPSSDASASAEPSAADASAAQALVPAGDDLAFVTEVVALQDDDSFRASLVVPDGWDVDTGFDRTYEPPTGSGLSIFTELAFSAGCDGMCEATTWEPRLRGPDGYLTAFVGDATADERPVAGSNGTVVVVRDDDGSVKAAVLRWDDSQPRYFQCTVSLESDQAVWLDAFVAACESSRPGWITVT